MYLDSEVFNKGMKALGDVRQNQLVGGVTSNTHVEAPYEDAKSDRPKVLVSQF